MNCRPWQQLSMPLSPSSYPCHRLLSLVCLWLTQQSDLILCLQDSLTVLQATQELSITKTCKKPEGRERIKIMCQTNQGTLARFSSPIELS